MDAALSGQDTAGSSCAPGCCGDEAEKTAYTLPDNIDGFFEARENGCA